MHRLDGWTFDPGAHALSREGETVRLEHRAAMLLALLCERRGATVSQPEILERVWGGRHVSANSVPVVIADLRRALGDDARRPRFIETVNKGGYRLVAPGPVPEAIAPARRRWQLALVAGGVAAIAIAATLVFAMPASRPRVTIAVEDVRNDTGTPGYATLAAATGGEILGRLAQQPQIGVARGGPAAQGAELRLTSKLVLWSGKPEILMEVVDPASGRLVWDSEIFVAEDRIPGAVAHAIDDLGAKVEAHAAAGGGPWRGEPRR